MENLYCGNCLDIFPTINDNSIDLIILDPNYQDWELFIDNGIIDQSLRVLKDTGNLICFTKQPFDFVLRNKLNPCFRREIVWTFTNGGAWVSNRMPLVSFQKIFWCVKSKNFFFNERTGVEYNSNTKDFKRSKKVFGGYSGEGREFKKNDKGVWLRDHLHYNKPQCGSIPKKPEELLRIILTCFCPSGGSVLDPFMGSGVIRDISYAMGMSYTGIELDKEKFNNITKTQYLF